MYEKNHEQMKDLKKEIATKQAKVHWKSIGMKNQQLKRNVFVTQ